MTEPSYPAPVPPVDALLDFSGRVAIVTGATGGIGAAIALRFAEAGAAVVVHYRKDSAHADAVVRAIAAVGGRAVAYGADLSQAENAERLLDATIAAFARVDVLVNNAGVYPIRGLLEIGEAEWDLVMDANLRSTVLCTQAAARQMISQGDGGAIVNVASIEGTHPAPGHAHYGAAKAGTIAYTRAAAQELAAHGVRVNAVSPGLVWRDGIERDWPEGVRRWHARAPLGRMGMPQDVADACLFLASPASRWITGAELTVDGGVSVARLY